MRIERKALRRRTLTVGPAWNPLNSSLTPPSPHSEAHVDWVGNRGGLAMRVLIAGLRQWDAVPRLGKRAPLGAKPDATRRFIVPASGFGNSQRARSCRIPDGLNMGWCVARAHMESFRCTRRFFLFTEGSCIALPVRRIKQADLAGRPVVPKASTPTRWSYLSVISMTWLTK